MSKLTPNEWISLIESEPTQHLRLYPCSAIQGRCTTCPFVEECMRRKPGRDRAEFIKNKIATAKLGDLFQ